MSPETCFCRFENFVKKMFLKNTNFNFEKYVKHSLGPAFLFICYISFNVTCTFVKPGVCSYTIFVLLSFLSEWNHLMQKLAKPFVKMLNK